jgi:hypothetical protein
VLAANDPAEVERLVALAPGVLAGSREALALKNLKDATAGLLQLLGLAHGVKGRWWSPRAPAADL